MIRLFLKEKNWNNVQIGLLSEKLKKLQTVSENKADNSQKQREKDEKTVKSTAENFQVVCTISITTNEYVSKAFRKNVKKIEISCEAEEIILLFEKVFHQSKDKIDIREEFLSG